MNLAPRFDHGGPKATDGRPRSSIWRKARAYAILNGLAVGVAATTYFLSTKGSQLWKNERSSSFLVAYISAVFRNLVFLSLVSLSCRRHNLAQIHGKQRREVPWRDCPGLFARLFFFAGPVDAVSFLLGQGMTSERGPDTVSQWAWEYATFIPLSLLWEVIFDLGHYIVHRLAHAVPVLYRLAHKAHHRYAHPSALAAYQHDPLDLVLSNLVPSVLAQAVVPLSTRQFHMIFAYKVFLEVAGHSGHYWKGSCFPQAMQLPQMLGIQIKTEDHDLHHSRVNCNYSKRFTLWDKLFGTYQAPEPEKVE
eukprot:jgi/Mesvir1/7944/Mv11865-RA.1